MDEAYTDVDVATEAQLHCLWAEQLADYRAMLRLAQDDTEALARGQVNLLSHSQALRQPLVQRIGARDRVLQSHGGTSQAMSQAVLEDIAGTIEAILTLDNQNQQHLKAEQQAVADELRQLKEGRSVLHQYKPHRQRPSQFFNSTV